ncbi:hypothetical protein C4D60_Mb08t22990 [Musa balbisiana]|uniref:Uncharacterized protein n=1 Tax=Musa balbisiana TaxID=52838 RepID=A0A4V4H950_MUSBA|nr:hypothetical protein C4D60_Mb08t22990 [Musa balbisiana]
MAHERPSSSPSASLTAEENNLFLDILHEAPLSGHRQPRGIFGSVLYCVLLAGYAVVAAAAPWIFLLVPKLVPTLLCSCNVLLLIITGLAYFNSIGFTRLEKCACRSVIWLLIFCCLSCRKCTDAACISLATVYTHIIYINIVEDNHDCGSHLCWMLYECIYWQSATPKQFFFTSATLVVKVVSTNWCIHQYNSLNGQPDILKSLYSALQPSSSLEDIRYYDGGRLSDQQMALLQYQRENLHYLSEEVLRLQECLSKYQRSDDGSTPQVDLAHLLASRDQELRALTAEMNQVHSELRLARSLIAERDSEVQHMRATNNQYIEENERLRAILGEWSARAAKLERALEAERMSIVELQKSIAKLQSKPPNQLADEHQE